MSNGIDINVNGAEELASALNDLSQQRFNAVAKITAQNIYNRGVAKGGTPFDTGELRQSMHVSVEGDGASVGYSKDYAPHVEFGHRTKGGGYVEGQHYLQRNVEAERPKYMQLMKENIRKVLK